MSNIIRSNVKAYFTLFWSKKSILTQDQTEIAYFNSHLCVDKNLECFLQFMEKHFRKMIFKRRLWWSLNHPVQAYRILRKNPQFLFDLAYRFND